MSKTAVFDGYVLDRGPITGVGRAFLHALAAYARGAPARLLVPPGVELPPIDGVDLVSTSASAGSFARLGALPRLLRRLDAHVLHVPVAAIPVRAPCPVVATVHDLPWRATTPLDEPASTGWRQRLAVRIAARRAAAVVVPSRATREDLLLDVPHPRAIIEVVPHGVPLPESAAPEALRDGPFLVLGDDRPRKNIPRVMRAHARAAAAHADLPQLDRLGPDTRYVDEVEKNARLRRARALLHVSLHEGFGLPILEAFGHGTPVLCSDRKSLPELAGGAALVVDPLDEAAIANALVRLHTDPGLRHGLTTDGRSRAALLTPDRTAARWAEIHREVTR